MDLGPLVPIAAMGVGLGWGIIGLKRKQLDVIARRATDEASGTRRSSRFEPHEGTVSKPGGAGRTPTND